MSLFKTHFILCCYEGTGEIVLIVFYIAVAHSLAHYEKTLRATERAAVDRKVDQG